MAQAASLWIKLGLKDDTGAGFQQVEKKFNQLGNRLSGLGMKITQGISIPLALASGAAIKLASDAVESESLFAVSMGKMAGAARQFSEKLRSELGLNAYEVRKNVGTFNVMIQSMGLSEKAAYDMSTSLTKLAYDMASFYNLAPEEAFEKLQAGLSGEIEPLKRLGIIVNETTVKNYALTNGIIKQGQEMSEAQKVAVRYAVIMQQTSKAQGDLSRTLDSPTNKMRILKEQFNQTAIDLGMALLPAFNQLLTAMKPITEAISRAVQWFSKLPVPIRNAVASIVALTIVIGPLLIVLGKLSSAISAIVGVTRLLGFAKIAADIGKVVAAAGGASGIVSGLAAAFGPFLVGAAIATGFVWLIAKVKEYAEACRNAQKDVASLSKTSQITSALSGVNMDLEQVRASKAYITREEGVKRNLAKQNGTKYVMDPRIKAQYDNLSRQESILERQKAELEKKLKGSSSKSSSAPTSSMGCPYCGQKFTNYGVYQKHVQGHTDDIMAGASTGNGLSGKDSEKSEAEKQATAILEADTDAYLKAWQKRQEQLDKYAENQTNAEQAIIDGNEKLKESLGEVTPEWQKFADQLRVFASADGVAEDTKNKLNELATSIEDANWGYQANTGHGYERPEQTETPQVRGTTWMEEYLAEMETFSESASNMAWDLSSNIQDALGDSLYDGMKNKFKGIGDIFQNLFNDILRMVSKMWANQAMRWFMNSFGSYIGTSAGVGQAGGWVNDANGGHVEYSGMSVPQYATGGITPNVSGGIPAVLHKNEAVLPERLTSFLMDAASSGKKSAAPNVQVNMINQSGVPLNIEQQSSQADVEGAIIGIVVKGYANNKGGIRDIFNARR